METTQAANSSVWRRAASGAILIAIAAAIIAISWNYPFGTVTQMGPGFIPFYVGLGIGLLGLAVLVMDLRATEDAEVEAPHWRGLIFICASILLFATLVNWAGLVPAMFLAVAVSMLADGQSRPLGILIYSGIVTLLGWLLFIQALGLPLSAFWR